MNQTNRTNLKMLLIDWGRDLDFVMEGIVAAALMDGYYFDISYKHPLSIEGVNLDYDIVFVSHAVDMYLDSIFETLKTNTSLQGKIVGISHYKYPEKCFRSLGAVEFVNITTANATADGFKDIWKKIMGLITHEQS